MGFLGVGWEKWQRGFLPMPRVAGGQGRQGMVPPSVLVRAAASVLVSDVPFVLVSDLPGPLGYEVHTYCDFVAFGPVAGSVGGSEIVESVRAAAMVWMNVVNRERQRIEIVGVVVDRLMADVAWRLVRCDDAAMPVP